MKPHSGDNPVNLRIGISSTSSRLYIGNKNYIHICQYQICSEYISTYDTIIHSNERLSLRVLEKQA